MGFCFQGLRVGVLLLQGFDPECFCGFRACRAEGIIRLMDKILHYFKYPKLWELWYIPYYG